MNNFSRKFLTAALAALAFVAVSCNEPDKKSASPGDLPAGRMDESPRINATTFFAHAHLLERQGAFDRAVEQYRKALELQPDFPTARNRLGITLNKLGRHAEATAEFQEAIRQKPNQSYLHNNLGFSQYLQGNYVQAEQSFIQAVTLQPGFARANMNLGLTLGRQGRFDEAYAAFRHASDDVTAYYNLAVVQSESGAYIDAVRSLDAALRVNPQYQPAVAYLRDISQLAADQEQAEQMRLAQLAASLPAPSSNDIPPRSADRTEYAASPDPTVGSEPAPTESTTASSDSAHSSRESQEELTAQSASAPPADAPQISGDGHQIETSRSEFVEADSNAQPSHAESTTYESRDAFAPPHMSLDPECDEFGNEITASWWDEGNEPVTISAMENWQDGPHAQTVVAGAVTERWVGGSAEDGRGMDIGDADIDTLLTDADRNCSRAELAAKLNETMEAVLQGRCAWSEFWCLLEQAAEQHGTPQP